MRSPGNRERGFERVSGLPGDFVVPGVALLPFVRQTLGTTFGNSCRIRRVLHQEFLAEVHQSDSVQVEYDFVDIHGSRREVACRFLDRYGTLLAQANVEVDLLS